MNDEQRQSMMNEVMDFLTHHRDYQGERVMLMLSIDSEDGMEGTSGVMLSGYGPDNQEVAAAADFMHVFDIIIFEGEGERAERFPPLGGFTI